MEALLEGVVAAVQPCSLALVLPGLGATLLGGRRGAGVAAAVWAVSMTVAWARAAGWLDTVTGPFVGPALAVLVVVGASLLWVGHRAPTPPLSRVVTGGALIGLGSGALWRPCVGPQLGAILTAAPSDPAGHLVPFLAYGLGLLAALAVVAALPFVDDRVAQALASRPARVAGAAPVAVLAAVLATGQYERAIGTLVRLSGLA